MQILIYKGKHGCELFKGDDELEALYRLFQHIDKIGYYKHFGLDDADQKLFYQEAKAGNKKAAATLLQVRRSYEYEGWEFEIVK
jgi:hypothetical protein